MIFDLDKNPQGYINYYNLTDWWLTSFSKEERNHMANVFQPMGMSKDTLIKGKFDMVSGNQLSFLTTLTGWFDNPRDRNLAHKIILKAEEFVATEKNVFNLHFFYPTKMKLFYKGRKNKPNALQIAINSALSQVGIAEEAKLAFKKEYSGTQLPAHEGYSRLCVILAKNGKFDEAIKYAKQAKKQGWNGDWDNRIIRYRKQSTKTNNISQNYL